MASGCAQPGVVGLKELKAAACSAAFYFEKTAIRFRKFRSGRPFSFFKGTRITEATLMEMVRHSQNQNYEALPIWYVEAESELGTTVVLVNAETAEEIFVQ